LIYLILSQENLGKKGMRGLWERLEFDYDIDSFIHITYIKVYVTLVTLTLKNNPPIDWKG